MSKFSVYLKELLDKRGEPIARIAKNAGLERTSIHKALKDERNLSYNALRQLEQYLQLTLPQIRELNQYYEMLLQGEETYRIREAICELLSEMSQLHLTSLEPGIPLKNMSKPPEVSTLVYGRPQVEAAISSIFLWETAQSGTELALYLPPEENVSAGLLHFWKAGRQFCVQQLVAFLPERAGGETRQENIRQLGRLLPLSLVSRGQYFSYYYFESSAAFVSIDPMPYFIITPGYLIHMDSRLSVARFETTPQVVALYRKRFSLVLSECQLLNSYSRDLAHVLDSYMKGTDQGSYYTLMTQPCLGHYYTRERIAQHFRPETQNRDMLIELSDRRFERLRNLTGEYYTIFTEEGLRKFALDGIAVDLPSDLIYPVNVRVRREILEDFREDIAKGRIKGCIADIERLPVPPYLTLTCDIQFGVHVYATEEFIDGAYANNLHIEECGIGQAFCSFIRSLPESKYVYPTERTLEILDELIAGLKGQ